MKGRFQSALEAKIVGIQRDRADQLANGSAKDHSEYMQQVGFIQGLAACLAMCDDTEQEIEGERRSAA